MIRIKSLLQIITYLCVITSYLSVMQYVELQHSIGFLALACVSVCLVYRRIIDIPRWLLNSISLIVLILSLTKVTSEYLVEPVLGALIILMAIKLLEDKKFRDYMQILAMCMFVLIGSSLISLDMIFMVYFLALALLSTISLILLAYFSHDSEMVLSTQNVVKLMQQALLICAIAIPTSTIFFVILPRATFPILSLLNKSGYARTGFSDRIRLGEVSEIQEDNTVIFRAEMDRVADSKLYWRGIVLDGFDGVTWKSVSERSETPAFVMEGPRVRQTIYLEPYGNKYLFALDKPVSFSVNKTRLSGQLTYPADEFILEKMRYTVASIPSESFVIELVHTDQYLQLPQGFSPRIRELVEDLAGAQNEDEKIKALFQFIKWGDYAYSMENLPVSAEPLEDFLLEHKKGNCEYFASSLAVMLRMAGIPARLVGGYRGGLYNKTGGYYMVLQNNAHVWVEAYTQSQGWRRLDPTPFSVEIGSVSSPGSFLLQVKLILDTFNYYWFKFVINYDFQKQLALLNKIRASISKPEIRMEFDKELATKIALWVLVFALGGGCILLYRLRRTTREEKLISRFARKMSGYGYERNKREGIEEFVSRIETEDLRERAASFVADFEGLFYKDRRLSSEDVKRLKERIDGL